MRRRLREQLRVREALLLDLGALVYELHRHGRRAPELLQHKAAELTAVDEEVRELQAALDGSHEPAREPTEVEAVDGEEFAEEDALDDEPGEDGELREDKLGEDEAGAERELRDAEFDDTTEFDAEEPADDSGLAEDEGGREGDERHEPTVAEHEEPGA